MKSDRTEISLRTDSHITINVETVAKHFVFQFNILKKQHDLSLIYLSLKSATVKLYLLFSWFYDQMFV